MSDILIYGMETPKSCAECLDIGWHYVFECRLDDMEDGERLPSCPLIPAADVRPVVRGKWELKTFDDGYGEYQLYECDKCGAVTAQRRNYCPNCGADMRAEEGE